MSIKIQSLTDPYIPGFREAVGSVAREKKYLAFLDSPPLEQTQNFVQFLRQHHMPHFVAVSGHDEVVGWCDISPLDRPVFNHVGELGIGVIDTFRRQGIGLKLIEAALEAARGRGLTRIELTVRDTNIPAIRLYEKMGFQVEGMHKNAVLIDGKYENHLSMALLW